MRDKHRRSFATTSGGAELPMRVRKPTYRPIPPTSASWNDLDFNLPVGASGKKPLTTYSNIAQSFYPESYSYHTGSVSAVHIPVHGGVGFFFRPPGYKGSEIFDATLSAVVMHRTTKQKYLLANQHELFSVEDYGSTIGNKPGGLLYFISDSGERSPFGKSVLNTTNGEDVDAALATPLVATSFAINQLGVPKGATKAVPGTKVKMMSWKSGFQRGTIMAPDPGDVADGFADTHVRCNIIAIPGDSGSVIMTDDGRQLVVGIDCCGPDVKNAHPEYFISALAIEKEFNVVFAPEELGIATTPTPTPTPGTNTPTTIPVNSFQSLIQMILDFLAQLLGVLNIKVTPAAVV